MADTEVSDVKVIAGAYLRVSQDPSQERRSHGGQWTDAQRVANNLDWDLRLRYTDTGSASVFGKRRGVARGDWDQLLKDVQSGTINGVILAELSRGTRELGAYAELAEAASDKGVLIAAGGRVFDLRDASDFMLAALEIVFADAEARRISKRVLRGVRSSVFDGRPAQGRTPFGYYRPPREIGTRVVQLPHPRNRHIWNASARYILLGGSISRVSRYWEQHAPIRANGKPAKWGPSQVRKALLNPAVLGLRVHKGEVTGKGTWEPITTPELFYSVYDLLNQPGRRLTETNESTCLLSGTVRCFNGHRMYRKRINGGVDYLVCQTGCSARMMKWIDGVTEDVAILVLAGLLRDATERSLNGPETNETEKDVAKATKDAEDARKALKDLMRELPGMRLQPADVAAMVTSYREAVNEAEKRLSELARNRAKAADSETTRIRQIVTRLGRPDVIMTGDLEELAEDIWSDAELQMKRRFIRDEIRISTLPGRFSPKSIESILIEPVRGWEWLEPYAPWWRQPEWA